MADELRSYRISNLAQGVSQQAPRLRRDTQCEEQFDCISSPVNGCEARPGIHFDAFHAGKDYSGSFEYEIFRADEEHYLAVITGGSTAGSIEVYDLANGGVPCTVTVDSGADAYLATGTRKARDVFAATTLEDVTFLANRTVLPEIDPAVVSPAARNEAVLYVRAVGYKLRYAVAITYDNKVYRWTYETPDNSSPVNAAYIQTGQVAATLYKLLTGTDAPITATGATATTTNRNVGPSFLGLAHGTASPGSLGIADGSITATSLGFTVRILGNVLLISRADAAAFRLDASDGLGDTALRAIKDYAQSFSDLPKLCFEGFTTRIQGSAREVADDYFVRYAGGDGAAGRWEEVVAPGVPLGLKAATMPHRLINTGPGTFTFGPATWGSRVCGDGVEKSKAPSFVGKSIYDLFYDNGRLGIVSEGSSVWSKARNPYVFFPTTAQTTLATDPVDITVGGGKTIALLRKAVQTDEAVFLWAPKVQFRVTSGQDPFKQDTVEAKPGTRFEFADKCAPHAVADSLYFATEVGPYATIRDLAVLEGKPRGFSDVTAHVKKYIPAGCRHITASDTLNTLAVVTEGLAAGLCLYNWLMGPDERLQSAWGKWRFPEQSEVLWASISGNLLHLLIQRPTGVLLGHVDLTVDLEDAEGVLELDANGSVTKDTRYLTRLDFRVTDEECAAAVYDATTDTSTITLPYPLEEAEDGAAFIVCQRDDHEDISRGHSWEVLSVSGDEVTVKGDAEDHPLFLGYRITAERLESRFHVRDQTGALITERLQVESFEVTYGRSGSFRVEVLVGRRVSTQRVQTTFKPSILEDGSLRCPVNSENTQASIRLVNDTFLPSRWDTAQYNYKAAFTAKPAQR